MIDVAKLVMALGEVGMSVAQISDILAKCTVAATDATSRATSCDSESARDRKRKADRERIAAKRAALKATHGVVEHDATNGATICDVAATHSATKCDSRSDTSRAYAPTRTQVVITSLPSEEVIIPPQEPSVLSPPKPESRKRKRTDRPKSRRCPDDWEPNAGHRELVLALGMSADRARHALEKFRDHEFARPYSDWDATFRNWLRNDAERTPNGSPGYGSSPAIDRQTANIHAMARGAEEALARRRGRWGSVSADLRQPDPAAPG